MARRSKQEILEEFHRFYDIFEALLDTWERTFANDSEYDFDRELIISRDQMLQCVADKKATTSQILSGVKGGLNDLLPHHIVEENPQAYERFLQHYKAITGRDLWEDVENPKQAAKAICKRGFIKDEVEFRMLNEIMNVGEQTIFSAEDAAKVENMLSDFEENYS